MTRIIAVKNYLSSRSNIEWSIMFISFAMVWMVSGYFYSPEIKTDEIVKESNLKLPKEINNKFNSIINLINIYI